uniref:Uncharacterized protein n=1 Tax=Plectus sambesii TaxID=2011161 RepID=A0A914VGX7_9BILA
MTLLRVLILVCIISLATSDRCGPGGCCCETCVYLGCENVPDGSGSTHCQPRCKTADGGFIGRARQLRLH